MATDYYETPEHLWEGQGPSRNADGSPRRDSTPSEVAWFSGLGQSLATDFSRHGSRPSPR